MSRSGGIARTPVIQDAIPVAASARTNGTVPIKNAFRRERESPEADRRNASAAPTMMSTMLNARARRGFQFSMRMEAVHRTILDHMVPDGQRERPGVCNPSTAIDPILCRRHTAPGVTRREAETG